MLASQAAQPPVGQGASVDTSPASGSAAGPAAHGGSGAASSQALSADYAMSLLARITHASADQALALIQALSAPVGAGGR